MFRQVEAVDALPFPLCSLSLLVPLVRSRSWFRHWGRGETGSSFLTLGSFLQSSWLEFWPGKPVATTPYGPPGHCRSGQSCGAGRGDDGEQWVGLGPCDGREQKQARCSQLCLGKQTWLLRGSLAPSLLRAGLRRWEQLPLECYPRTNVQDSGLALLAEGRVRTSGPVIPGLISDPRVWGPQAVLGPGIGTGSQGTVGPCGLPGEEGGQEQMQVDAHHSVSRLQPL